MLNLMKKQLLALLAFTALLLAVSPPARAVDLHDVLIDYTLTSFARKDGLTGPVWSIAQDGDGFLWLGTDEGLMRFDGARFTNWDALGGDPLPRSSVRAVKLARDGSLWIGFAGNTGVARIRGKRVETFPAISAADSGTVVSIVEDNTRAIWVAAAAGLFKFDGSSWQQLGAAQGLPDNGFTNAYVDTIGTVWVGTGNGWYWRPGATQDRFQQIEASNDAVRALSVSEDPSGRIWANDPVAGYRTLGDRVAPPRGVQAGRGFRLLHDHDGNLWVGTIGQGLWRVRNAADPASVVIEKATVLSGLSSDAVRCIFEDRDGNIWAGTTEGVDRLLPHRITPWTSLGLVSTIDANDTGYVWVGNEDELIRFSRGSSGEWEPAEPRVPIRGVRLVRVGGRGRAWVLSTDGIFRVDNFTATAVPLPAGVTPSSIEAIAGDRRGGVWAVATGGMILHDDNGRLRIVDRLADLKATRVQAAAADANGRLWLAYGSRIAAFEEQAPLKTYENAPGLVPGVYLALNIDRGGALWISSTSGLSRFADGHFTAVTAANGLPPSGIYSFTEDDDGKLWLATAGGIIRLARSEFDAAAGSDRRMHFRIFDTSEGLAGNPTQLNDHNAVRASDGSLWFITSRGVSSLDPAAVAKPRPAPRITIDDVQANDVATPSGNLPAGTTKLQFDYTAPELTYPLRTRFRYRLDGFDTSWVDAGTRRQVLYTNLPPRRYTFRVAASDDEGRWSDAEVAHAFAIAPRFYQTWWFYALAAVSIAGGLGGAYQLRLRQLRKQFSLVLGERVRLSRELHDTLLQSLVGLALEFDTVSRTIETSPAAARQRVVKIRERVEEYIREARRSIWSLRSPALETADLLDALRASGEKATSGHPVDFLFSSTGSPRRQPANVEHQLLRIGQEAVLNAVRHAGASHIRMELRYDDHALTLRISDDGRGFELRHAGEGTTTDHYGITTMHERAQQVGGRVSISSTPGKGTVIEAVVPTSKESPAEAA